jgi:hypothetical protein
MGGSVACRSQLGAGATFLFRLRGHTPPTAMVSSFSAEISSEPAQRPGDRAA